MQAEKNVLLIVFFKARKNYTARLIKNWMADNMFWQSKYR